MPTRLRRAGSCGGIGEKDEIILEHPALRPLVRYPAKDEHEFALAKAPPPILLLLLENLGDLGVRPVASAQVVDEVLLPCFGQPDPHRIAQFRCHSHVRVLLWVGKRGYYLFYSRIIFDSHLALAIRRISGPSSDALQYIFTSFFEVI